MLHNISTGRRFFIVVRLRSPAVIYRFPKSRDAVQRSGFQAAGLTSGTGRI
jgi:hypothetical protein